MRYFTNTSWLFGEKILRLTVGLFVGVWVARYLGPEQFGLFNYAQSFVGLFAAIATLGLDGIVVRELVKDPSRRDELIGTSFWLKLMGAVAVLLLLLIAIQFTSNDHYTNVLIFIIASATIFQSFNIVDIYFQAKVLSKYVVYANIVSLFSSSIVKVVLILNNASLTAFAWAVLFDSVILALGFIYFFFKHIHQYVEQSNEAAKKQSFKIKNLIFNKTVALYLLKDSWPLILSSIITMLYMRIDQIMIKQMISSVAVGQYSAAVRISEVWYFIPVILANSLFPSIITSKNISYEEYQNKLQKFYSLMVITSLPASFIIAFFSDLIITILYGVAYFEAIAIFKVHIFTSIFVFMFVASGKWILAENYTKLAFYRNSSAAFLNIILNYTLIPKYGAIGAAYGTIIAFAMSGYFFDLLSKKTRKQFILKSKAFCLKGLFDAHRIGT